MNQNINIFTKKLAGLARDSVTIVDDMISDQSNNKAYREPIFKNGQLAEIKEESKTDYTKINRLIRCEDDLNAGQSFQIAVTTLTSILNNMVTTNKMGKDIDIDEVAKELIWNFLTQFARERQNDPSTALLHSSRRLKEHIAKNLTAFTYLTPLYNMDANADEIVLSEQTIIRRITNDEYTRIVIGSKSLKDIEQYERRLKFIILHHVNSRNSSPLDEAKNEYAFITNLIRLTGKISPEFGRIYLLNSTNLNVLDMTVAETYHATPRLSGFTTMTAEDNSILLTRYTDTKTKIKRIKKPEFLTNSISRFGMAQRHRQQSNSVVDYVIALESLLIDGTGESTFKLAHRVSALCGDDDDERVQLWEFIKSVYKFRSGVVHGAGNKPVTINMNLMHMDEVSRRLSMITANAILRVIDVLSTYDRQEDMLVDLDRSMYDRKIISKFQSDWNLSYGDVNNITTT